MTITYKNRLYEPQAGETVLDTLLRHKVSIPYSCKAGICNICVMVGNHNEHPITATNGLKNTLVRQGYFRTCQSIPSKDITLKSVDRSSLFTQASVLEKDILAPDVCRIRISPATDLFYHAGQHINLRTPNGDVRSYSLASLPAQDEYLELHVKRMENGIVSNWLFNEVQVNDILNIQGPFGECFYLPENDNGDILMIGTGTGLAPLIGILRDAINCGHHGKIDIYHGARSETDLYFHKPLEEISKTFKNVNYFPCLSKTGVPVGEAIYQSLASDLAFSNNTSLKGHLVYLCGSPSMVASARKQAYLLGADMKQIYIDPFITKNLRQAVSDNTPPRNNIEERRNLAR